MASWSEGVRRKKRNRLGMAMYGWNDNKSPLGGEGTGANPTNRGKSCTKRSLLTDGKGIPISLAVEGANRHDIKLTEPTLKIMIVERPKPTKENPQHMCLDKGYDYPEIHALIKEWGYTTHIKARGEEIRKKRNIPLYRAIHWVVERTHSWINRFRRLLIRWEKKVEHYLAMLNFACEWITFRANGLFE